MIEFCIIKVCVFFKFVIIFLFLVVNCFLMIYFLKFVRGMLSRLVVIFKVVLLFVNVVLVFIWVILILFKCSRVVSNLKICYWCLIEILIVDNVFWVIVNFLELLIFGIEVEVGLLFVRYLEF